MTIGSKVACNRPSQDGNDLSFGVIASSTRSGYWVRQGNIEHFYPKCINTDFKQV